MYVIDGWSSINWEFFFPIIWQNLAIKIEHQLLKNCPWYFIRTPAKSNSMSKTALKPALFTITVVFKFYHSN